MVGAARVLMYHGFGDRSQQQDPHNLFVTGLAFESQLALLASRGWTALDLDGYLSGIERRRWPTRSYLITIDDGYPSVLEIAVPILQRRGVPAVLFVPPGRLGGTSGWMPEMPNETIMSADMLREVARYGIEVGAHGWDHSDMLGMHAAELRRHAVDAKTALADVLGVTPRSFAYPRGVYDEQAQAAVVNAGYAIAFAVHDGGGRWAVKRTDVNALDTPRSFQLKMSPLWGPAYALARRAPAMRRTAHRLLGLAQR
jgi:peptidoglycan/xylan/chitin deacetylase (PgdA/CDA1 family)